MTTVCFITRGKQLCGFEISGHAGAGEAGYDIVCAAVSSAAYLIANTLTDVVGVDCEAVVDDGYMKLMITEDASRGEQTEKECQHILEGLRLHIEQLREQYPKNIRITSVNTGKEQHHA